MPVKVQSRIGTTYESANIFVTCPMGMTGVQKREAKYQLAEDFVVEFEGSLDESEIHTVALKLLCALDVQKVHVEPTRVQFTCSTDRYWPSAVLSPEEGLSEAVKDPVPSIVRKLKAFDLEQYSLTFTLENYKGSYGPG